MIFRKIHEVIESERVVGCLAERIRDGRRIFGIADHIERPRLASHADFAFLFVRQRVWFRFTTRNVLEIVGMGQPGLQSVDRGLQRFVVFGCDRLARESEASPDAKLEKESPSQSCMISKKAIGVRWHVTTPKFRRHRV